MSALRPRKEACSVGSRRAVGVLSSVSSGLVRAQAQTWRRVGRRAAHSANARPSDWARRNLRSLRDGAAGFNAGGIAGAGGWSLRCWVVVATWDLGRSRVSIWITNCDGKVKLQNSCQGRRMWTRPGQCATSAFGGIWRASSRLEVCLHHISQSAKTPLSRSLGHQLLSHRQRHPEEFVEYFARRLASWIELELECCPDLYSVNGPYWHGLLILR
jgi:hypothetical protein